MTKLLSRRAALLATIALAAVPAAMIAKSGEVRMRTSLSGGSISGLRPSGHADFRAIPGENRSRLNVEVEDVNLPAGTVVTVHVNGSQVGTITISAAPIRGGELELNTQDGQAVPAVRSGAMVVVRNAGTAILSGVLN